MKFQARFFAALIGFFALLNLPSFAKADGFLGLSIGYYNALDQQERVNNFRLEYFPSKSITLKNLRPWLGMDFTKNLSMWAGGGLAMTFEPYKKIFVTPSVGLGLYRHGRKDVDLDYPVIFRSQLQVAYGLANQDRFGLAFSHTSSAGLGGDNPGAEIISLYYTIKLRD